MKDNAIVCNIGHFDNEIQVARLEENCRASRDQAAGRPCHLRGRQAHHPAGARPSGEPGLRHGHPSYVMSSLRQPDALRRSSCDAHKGRLRRARSTLPKHLDEKVARPQLTTLNAHAHRAEPRGAGRLHRRAGGRGPYKLRHLPLPMGPSAAEMRRPMLVSRGPAPRARRAAAGRRRRRAPGSMAGLERTAAQAGDDLPEGLLRIDSDDAGTLGVARGLNRSTALAATGPAVATGSPSTSAEHRRFTDVLLARRGAGGRPRRRPRPVVELRARRPGHRR